jgi:pseudomonalisin
MAAVTALLNTKVGVSQGNLNPLLYKLASSTSGSSVFHDASVATSGVASCSVAIPSMCNNSTPGPGSTFATVTGGEEGYLLNTGYDEVTGLGSIDVANFLTAAAAIAPTFTITPTSSSLSLLSGATSGNADTIAIASLNSFAGTVALTCTVTTTSGNAAGSCSVLPTSVVLNNNSSSTVLTIATTFGTAGTLSVTVTGTSGTTTVNSAAISVTVTGASLSLSAPAALSLTSGATAANTTTTTLSSVNAFSGTVALSCSISASSEVFPPTCAVSPASAVLTAGGSGVVTIAIGSTTAQARTGAPQQAGLSGWGLKGAALLCGLMLCMARVRSKRAFGSLAAFALLAAGLLAVSGCSSSSGSGSSGGGVTHGSSAGSYIVTVTATGTTGGGTVSTTATTSFSLTIH